MQVDTTRRIARVFFIIVPAIAAYVIGFVVFRWVCGLSPQDAAMLAIPLASLLIHIGIAATQCHPERGEGETS